jgi:hypothetical protein
MAWELSDPYGVEADLEAMGPAVWQAWNEVMPRLLADPSPTNPELRITETHAQQLWLSPTDVYVLFFLTDDQHVLLIEAVDLLDGVS